jgi:hypothetical protein
VVLFRQRGVHVALRNLQAPQPIGQKKKNGEDNILHRSQADRRELFIAAEHKSVVGPWSLVVGHCEVVYGLTDCKSSASGWVDAVGHEGHTFTGDYGKASRKKEHKA